jgi:hypothetical protein
VLFLPFEKWHRAFRKPKLISITRVAFRFLQRVPTKDRHELPRRCAVVCCDGRAGLSQAVSPAGNACFNATIMEDACEWQIGIGIGLEIFSFPSRRLGTFCSVRRKLRDLVVGYRHEITMVNALLIVLVASISLRPAMRAAAKAYRLA